MNIPSEGQRYCQTYSHCFDVIHNPFEHSPILHCLEMALKRLMCPQTIVSSAREGSNSTSFPLLISIATPCP